MSIKDKFDAAVNVIKGLPKNGPFQPSHDMMLKFYGLYKQATEGPCNQPKPAFYEVVKSYKWNAWNCLGDMHEEQAMNTYVEELKKIVETMRYTDDVADFIESIGPFFEFTDILNGTNEDSNHNVAEVFIKGENKDKLNDKKPSNENKLNPPEETNGELLPNHSKYDDPSYYVNGEQDIMDESPMKVYDATEDEVVEHVINVKKFLSDTDTEDEYSEPAEFIEVTNSCLDSSAVEAVTCGGGDASQAGHINMDYTQKRKQGNALTTGQMSDGETSAPKLLSGGGGGRRHRNLDSTTTGGVEVNAQLILILQKIHHDLQAVVVRLDTLESQAYSQHADMCSFCQRRVGRTYNSVAEKSWWPLPELSPRSTFFLLTWPLVLQVAVKLFLFLRSKRRRRKIS